MNDGLLHMIQSRNFGMDLDGILVGPYLIDGSLKMKLLDRQGNEVSMKKESADVPVSYMKEAGYLPGEDLLLVLKNRISRVSNMDEWTKAPFCVMIIKCDKLFSR